MTRVLSELLGAQEPMFHRGLSRLETASGRAGTDIRLTNEIEQLTKHKLREIALDPADTTGAELYSVLQAKVGTDDAILSSAFRERYGGEQLHYHVAQALADLPVAKGCFSLKTAVGRRLLTALPPKRTMKALGYRSFDSMMRREPLTAVFAAGWLLEAAGWRKAMLESYKKLHPTDFELRQLSIVAPVSDRWRAVSEGAVAEKKHNIVGLKELGAVVILPLPARQPSAATMAMVLLGLHELNEVRAGSTYLKFCQVRPDFGQCVRMIVAFDPAPGLNIFGGRLPWQIVQRYYARYAGRFRTDIFEPHVQKEDFAWHSVEQALNHIEPRLGFWRGTACAGLLHDHKPVSMNVLDAVLSLCNQLPFENRIVHYFQHSLWHELIIRYLRHPAIEQAALESADADIADPAGLLYS